MAPTRHNKYRVINSPLVTKQLWQISFLQPTWNDFYEGLNLRLRVNISRVNCPKVAKMAIFKTP